MVKFEEFCARLREDSTNNLQRKWMNTDEKKKKRPKVTNVQLFMITKKKLHQTFKK